jgi:DNA-binding NarL/FixJ family response regulator
LALRRSWCRSGSMDSSCGGIVTAGLGQKSNRIRRVQVTRRQEEILQLAAMDLGDKQIAHQLGVSLSTVRTQLGRFYRANGLHSRAGAVGLWLEERRPRG